jgi:hypothetical protein
MQPPVDQIDARHSRVENCTPHVVEALLGQRPQLFGMIKTDAFDDAVDIFGISRKHETHVPARRRPRHLPSVQNDNRPASLGDLSGNGEARKAGANHADIDVEVEVESRPLRT